jgi:hypothetical protein
VDRKRKISLSIFAVAVVAGSGFALLPGLKSTRFNPSETARIAQSAPRSGERFTPKGSLLSMQNPDQEIARAKSRRLGRSPAVESDATRELEFAKLARDFIDRNRLSAEYEKLAEFFPNGKGVNQSIRLLVLASGRPAEGENAFYEILLANRVKAEIHANPEAALVSLDQGLAKMPREMGKERFVVVRLLSNLAIQNPSLREDAKAALLSEAQRSATQAEGALIFAALLRVNSSKEWVREVTRAFEKFHPGAELSDFVSVNVVAL